MRIVLNGKVAKNVTVTKHDDGRINVTGQNEYYADYEIDYTPPGYELVDDIKWSRRCRLRLNARQHSLMSTPKKAGTRVLQKSR